MFCSTNVAVTKVHGNIIDCEGTTVKYGTVYIWLPGEADSSSFCCCDIHARYFRAAVRTDRQVQATRHARVSGGMFIRGMGGVALDFDSDSAERVQMEVKGSAGTKRRSALAYFYLLRSLRRTGVHLGSFLESTSTRGEPL